MSSALNDSDEIFESRLLADSQRIEEYHCPVCYMLMVSPEREPRCWMGCGHEVCMACVPNLNACPMCRSAKRRALPTNPSLRTKRAVMAFKIRCANQPAGCEETPTLDSVGAHEKSCAFGPEPCPYCNEAVLRNILEAHKSGCGNLPAECPGAKFGCTESINRAGLEDHKRACRSYFALKEIERITKENDRLKTEALSNMRRRSHPPHPARRVARGQSPPRRVPLHRHQRVNGPVAPHRRILERLRRGLDNVHLQPPHRPVPLSPPPNHPVAVQEANGARLHNPVIRLQGLRPGPPPPFPGSPFPENTAAESIRLRNALDAQLNALEQRIGDQEQPGGGVVEPPAVPRPFSEDLANNAQAVNAEEEKVAEADEEKELEDADGAPLAEPRNRPRVARAARLARRLGMVSVPLQNVAPSIANNPNPAPAGNRPEADNRNPQQAPSGDQPEPAPQAQPEPARPRVNFDQICNHYARGMCNRGRRCRFEHPGYVPPVAAIPRSFPAYRMQPIVNQQDLIVNQQDLNASWAAWSYPSSLPGFRSI